MSTKQAGSATSVNMSYLRNNDIPFMKRLLYRITYNSNQENRREGAKALAAFFGVSRGIIYNTVNLARRDGIGIHTTPEGYVMSKMASREEDIRYIQRMNWMRRTTVVGMNAASPSIVKRWSTRTSDGRYIHNMVKMFQGNLPFCDDNVNILNDMLNDNFDI
jgi:hypothetical protein